MKNNIYDIYAKEKKWETPEIHRNRIKEYEINYLRFIDQKQKAKVLDVGCGQGCFLDFLKKHGFSNYLGIDINRKLVKICEAKGHKVILADVFEFLKETEERFDIILFNDVLEHFRKEDAVKLLGFAKSVLKNHGICIARVPNANYPFSNTIRYRDYTHMTIYEMESLQYLLKLAGFEVIHIGGFLSWSKNRVRGLLRRILLKFNLLLMLIIEGEIRPNETNIFAIATRGK
ncbi:MAG: class I SAM-dependent methyltransferase [Candidatus Kariarchaeaceae archaeon]|jgi:2-polyprenyl-3-methyl-5-hydroxy-6-metoxy-1,4-benzoquinol methylase